MVEELIKHLRKNTKYEYVFNATSKTDDVIVYSFSDGSDNGIKKIGRLTLQIITNGITENSILKSERIKKEIGAVILTKGDNSLTSKILSVVQNGGGLVSNLPTNTLHRILYYDIIYKE